MDDEVKLLDKLGVIKIQGHDRRGAQIVRIIGKLFPGGVSSEGLKKYLEEKILPKIEEKAWSIVYIHTGVERGQNFPGISTLRSIYDAIPHNVKLNLVALYFLHPGLQAKLFFATFGRFLFSAGLYWKLKYVNRVEFLWEHVKRSEMEIPDFVYEHDEELEYRPMMDFGIESDFPQYYASPMIEASVTLYSTRCIA